MKKIIMLVIIMLNISVFTGCTPFYTLKPSYNENTHTLMIDHYIFNKATETLGKKITNISSGIFEYKRFNTNDINCKKLAYKYYDISNTNKHYIASAIEDIQDYYNNKCDIEKINNLSFFQCKKNYEVIINKVSTNETKYHYGITSSETKESGYGTKTTVYLGNKAKCFVAIREYFLNKNNSDSIKKN